MRRGRLQGACRSPARPVRPLQGRRRRSTRAWASGKAFRLGSEYDRPRLLPRTSPKYSRRPPRAPKPAPELRLKFASAGIHAVMGIIISLILIAFGAILTWAVNTSGGTVDPQVVGVILMVVGLVVFLISVVLWRTWWGAGFWGRGPGYAGPADEAVVRRRVYRPAVRRTTYVEEEPSPPAGPPAP